MVRQNRRKEARNTDRAQFNKIISKIDRLRDNMTEDVLVAASPLTPTADDAEGNAKKANKEPSTSLIYIYGE